MALFNPALSSLLLLTISTFASAWGKTPKKAPKPKTLLQKLVPLVGLLVAVAILAIIGLIVFQTMQSIQGQVSKKLDEKNIKLSATGAEVGVQGDGMTYEEYQDKTQSAVVNMWNNSEMKGFKSRIWGPKEDKKGKTKKTK